MEISWSLSSQPWDCDVKIVFHVVIWQKLAYPTNQYYILNQSSLISRIGRYMSGEQLEQSTKKLTRFSNFTSLALAKSVTDSATRSIWKMLGPFATASCRIAIHQVLLLSHAACASMSTTTTTTRDRGDRYGPREWAQWMLPCFLQLMVVIKLVSQSCSSVWLMALAWLT